MSSSVYSTVPNSSIFFKQCQDELQEQAEAHIALTPPNTPTHGVIISMCPTPDDLHEELLAGGDGEAKAYLMMNNSDNSAQSTPTELRSMCETPDSVMVGAHSWHIPQLDRCTGPKWSDLDNPGKIRYLGRILLKISALLTLLYVFICSLDLLSTSFRLLGAHVIGGLFRDSKLLMNPVVGLMIGVLVTVLVQSSSTSTSIAVTMVGSGIIGVGQAIPMMMGANIGTSVTNTIVSLMQSADRDQFGRAFAAATVHDMFNWLTVIVLLPIEVITGYLERLTTWLMSQSTSGDLAQDKSSSKTQFVNHMTKPLTRMIIQIDETLLESMAYGNDSDIVNGTGTIPHNRHLLKRCVPFHSSNHGVSCSLFGWLGFADTSTGLVLLVLSILVLCLCLMMLVKLLNSMLSGQIARLIKRTMNRSYSFPYSMVADYLSILIGCVLTILVQSSSIFTSALTPLAGIGVISLERIYPLTLGANIGTTTTGLLAALAAEPKRLHDTMQIALCHLMFNLTGIVLFYPLPVMRLPIRLARALGSITSRYRWFSILYLLVMFLLLPTLVFLLSTLSQRVMVAIMGAILIVIVIVLSINQLQQHRPLWLPVLLRDWHFLPLWMRSLDPWDAYLTKFCKRLGWSACLATSGQLQHLTLERANDSGKLTDRNDVHQSRLHILGAMYRSNSQDDYPINESFLLHRHLHARPSVNETIKKVISKLTKANQTHSNSHANSIRHTPSWSLFNSNTVHNCTQFDRHYPSVTAFTDPPDAAQQQTKDENTVLMDETRIV